MSNIIGPLPPDQRDLEIRKLHLEIENIVLRWKTEKEAMILQIQELQKQVEPHGPRTWLVCGHRVEPSNADHCSTCLKTKLEQAKVDRDCCCAGTEVLRVKLEETNRLNDDLLKWAQEQVRSHQRICAEAYDRKDERNGDIHNSLACAYVSLVKEIQQRTEKRYHEGDGHICIAAEGVPCPLCGRKASQ